MSGQDQDQRVRLVETLTVRLIRRICLVRLVGRTTLVRSQMRSIKRVLQMQETHRAVL